MTFKMHPRRILTMTRKISTEIVNALKTAKRDVALSRRDGQARDTVRVNLEKAIYVLWNTWIVELNRETGELEWNTSDFTWRNSRTTQSRIRDLQYLLNK